MSTAVVQRDLDTDHMAAQEGEWGAGGLDLHGAVYTGENSWYQSAG